MVSVDHEKWLLSGWSRGRGSETSRGWTTPRCRVRPGLRLNVGSDRALATLRSSLSFEDERRWSRPTGLIGEVRASWMFLTVLVNG